MKWENIPLRQIVKVHYGKALKAQDRIESGSIPVYGSSGQVGTHTKTLVDYPTLIIGRKGSVGEVIYAEQGGWPIDTVFYTQFLNPNEIDLRYFFHTLKQADLARWTITTSIPGLNRNDLYSTKIPLPPLEEQRRIAAILDKADEVRRKRKEAIRLTEELLRSAFLEMFGDPVTNPKGWEKKRLSEVCEDFQNGIGKNKEHYGRGTKVANISDLYEWHRFSPEKYSLLDVTPEEIKKYSLKKGDLLFVRSSVKREGVAVCSAYNSDEICLFSSFMIRVRPQTNLINSDFLALMLRTSPMRSRLISASNTSTITNISQPGLSKVEVFVPPLATQNLITTIAQNVEVSVQRHVYACNDANNLFASLLQRAFRGEL